MKIPVSVQADRKAALLNGVVLQDRVTVEICRDDYSANEWAALVNNLNVSQEPAQLNSSLKIENNHYDLGGVTESGGADFKAQFAKSYAKYQADLDDRAERVAEYKADLAAAPIESARIKIERYCGSQYDRKFGDLEFDGFSRKIPLRPSVRYRTAEIDQLFQAAKDELDGMNKAAYEAALPALEVALAEKKAVDAIKAAERAEAARKAEENEAAALAARKALRLKTGLWEKEVTRGNPWRYGAYWVAKIISLRGDKLDYRFSNLGDESLLRIACRPGEMIAYGQKDFHGRNGEHNIFIMLADGGMQPIGVAEAKKVFLDRARKAAHETKKIRAEATATTDQAAA